MTHLRILLGIAFHMNGPLYANEFLKISRLAYGNVTKLVGVEFLVSLIATSLQIVMQSRLTWRYQLRHTLSLRESHFILPCWGGGSNQSFCIPHCSRRYQPSRKPVLVH